MLKEGLFNRAAAAYAMQILTTPRAIRDLEEVVKDKLERPCEGRSGRGTRTQSLEKITRCASRLGDSGKDVRFWCAFVLGRWRRKRAIPARKSLVVRDRRMVKGFHSVAQEAADAIANIQKTGAQRRKNGCMFWVSS